MNTRIKELISDAENPNIPAWGRDLAQKALDGIWYGITLDGSRAQPLTKENYAALILYRQRKHLPISKKYPSAEFLNDWPQEKAISLLVFG